MSGYTPGPLSWRDNDLENRNLHAALNLPEPEVESGWFDILDSKGNTLGAAYMLSREGNQANAMLWSAAPDLLEALDDLYWLATENERLGAHKETYDKAQTAIAKATGQDNG